MDNRYPETIVRRVVDALIARGADAVLEYPGYVHIQTERGKHYATGIANDTWTIDRLGEDRDTLYSIDTEIPTSNNDARAIASAIDGAIHEDCR